jgi:hypothetical protein
MENTYGVVPPVADAVTVPEGVSQGGTVYEVEIWSTDGWWTMNEAV